MTDATRLDEAYRLILDDQHEQALGILRAIVAQEPENADAWWLISYTVDDPEEAHAALNKVLALNPGHGEAQAMLATLQREFPDLAPSPAGVTQASPVAEPTKAGANYDFDLDSDPFAEVLPGAKAPGARSGPGGPFDDSFEGEPAFVNSAQSTPQTLERPETRRMRTSLVPILLLAVVILVVLVGVFVLLPRLNPPASPTSVAANPTVPATAAAAVNSSTPTAAATVAAVATSAPTAAANQTALDSAAKATAGDLLAAGFTAPKVSFGSTPIDANTMMASLCAKLGPDLQKEVNQAMDLIAPQANQIRTQIGAAGIEVTSCSDATQVLYRAYVPIADISAYVTGGLKDRKTFRASWKH
ncbi:MAG TPA: tetratricopeptide repeat protein [Aggregatilineales bacterium]|nr:tetratricopeptide repeat protein [Aggregatilineales bacterium]